MSIPKKSSTCSLSERNAPITFEKLPEAINQVLSRLDNIESILAAKVPEDTSSPPITTQQLCKFLNITEPTVIRLRSKGILPFMRIGSAVRFDLKKVVAALENKKLKN